MRKWFTGSSSRLLKLSRKFSFGFLKLKKFFSVYVFKIRFICVQSAMYAMFKFNYAICQDLSSFKVYIELFHFHYFPLLCMRKTLELKVSELGEKVSYEDYVYDPNRTKFCNVTALFFSGMKLY